MDPCMDLVNQSQAFESNNSHFESCVFQWKLNGQKCSVFFLLSSSTSNAPDPSFRPARSSTTPPTTTSHATIVTKIKNQISTTTPHTITPHNIIPRPPKKEIIDMKLLLWNLQKYIYILWNNYFIIGKFLF